MDDPSKPPDASVNDREALAADAAGTDDHSITPAELLLWTPTEGQDITKSIFPLNEEGALLQPDEEPL
jgi:hypothetical protein